MSMSQSPRRAVVLLAVLSLLLAGCAQVITGRGSTTDAVRPNVKPSDLEIVGSTDQEIDTLARNALADLNDFWSQAYPAAYGSPWKPLTGGYYSVDPGNYDASVYPDNVGCFSSPDDVAGNAFYCFPQQSGGGDDIVYDRTLLESLATDYGRFIPALVMAHEFGHAVQARTAPPSNLSIVFETQADCFAGAWTAWVADDKAKHFLVRPSELDDVLRGYLLLRDRPGSGPSDNGAHGSYFDRVSGFQEGFDNGAAACKDNFNDQRVFTQAPFATQAELDTNGNAPYDAPIGSLFEIAQTTLDQFWKSSFTDVFHKQWSAPALQPFEGAIPRCGGDRQRREVTYCAADNRVDYDNSQLIPKVYDDIGDFGVVTLLAIQYATAARNQLGLDYRGEPALRSSICLTGWYAGRFLLDGNSLGATISPGDFDEAVQVLLEYGSKSSVLPDVGLSGFQLIDLFRQGFLRGASACDVGVA